MVPGKETQVASLVYVAVLILLYILPVRIETVAIGTEDTPFLNRFIYQNFHANMFHLLCNVWALLTITFYSKINMARLVIAYLISSTYPFTGEMIVGLSGVCYTLIGMLALRPATLKNKLVYQVYALAFILIGLAIPNVCVGIHLYCYSLGVVFAFLDTPLKPKSK